MLTDTLDSLERSAGKVTEELLVDEPRTLHGQFRLASSQQGHFLLTSACLNCPGAIKTICPIRLHSPHVGVASSLGGKGTGTTGKHAGERVRQCGICRTRTWLLGGGSRGSTGKRQWAHLCYFSHPRLCLFSTGQHNVGSKGLATLGILWGLLISDMLPAVPLGVRAG